MILIVAYFFEGHPVSALEKPRTRIFQPFYNSIYNGGS